jgi:hypothetical protein
VRNFIAANPRSPDFSGERNDCVVRALSIASGLHYATAHEYCAKAGRPRGRGMYDPQVDRAISLIEGKQVEMEWSFERRTFAEFARLNPVGRFIVLKRGHAVALVDGVYHDMALSICGARSIVRKFYRFEERAPVPEPVVIEVPAAPVFETPAAPTILMQQMSFGFRPSL